MIVSGMLLYLQISSFPYEKNIVSYIFSKHGFILEHLQIYRIYWKVDICDPEALLAMRFKFLDEYYLNLLILKSSVLVTVTKYYY